MHIPFCVKKCRYCDFLSFENESAVIHKVYTKALVREIKGRAEVYNNNFTVDSIFIGGGTPSLILPGMIEEVTNAVKDNFNTSDKSEITIEANPRTLSPEKLDQYISCGINRISIGAQTFNDYLLKILGRIHVSDDISKTCKMARAAGFKNLNIDLIFGIAAQSMGIWEETLEKTLELEPEHVSFYSLQLEEGTKLHEMLARGTYKKVSDELDREMYHYAIKTLKRAGYAHYEISNAAKSGYECRHNMKYWSMRDYLGVGLGAHSYMCGKRFGNIKDLEEYIAANLENQNGPPDYERHREWNHENSVSDQMSEYMFTGLRRIDGIDPAHFEKKFNKPLKSAYFKEWPEIERYVKKGFLISDGRGLRLSEKGIDISNKIMSEFILSSGRCER